MFRYLLITLTILISQVPGHTQIVSEEDSVLRDIIWDYGNKGLNYLKYNINLDSSEFYLKKAIELQETTPNYDINDRVAANYISLASFYRIIYNNKEALACLNRAEKILKDLDPNHLSFGALYHNKGNVYKETGDLFRTKEYYEYALDFLNKNGYQNSDDFVFIHSNYIKLLLELEFYELAESKLTLINSEDIGIGALIKHRIHVTNATTYSNLGNYELALYHFTQAKKIVSDQNVTSEYINEIIVFYYAYIDFLIQYSKYQEALIECERALSYISALDPLATKGKITFSSDILYRSASIQHRIGNQEKALSSVNFGIENLRNFLLELSFGDSEAAQRNEYTTSLPDLYVLKSQILYNQYRESNQFDQLRASYGSYQKTIETMNFMKLAMGNENSKLFATSQILDVYNEAINVALLMLNQTNDNAYLEQAFEFAETSKSFALYSEIKNVEAMQFSDLPSYTKDLEARLMGEKQAYEEALYEEQLSAEPDLEKIAELKEVFFHLKDDYDDMMREIAQNNAKYYELKYQPKFVSLSEVQEKLPHKDALIEYVLSDTMLITFVIDKKGINIISQEIDPVFADECIEYYQLLHDQNFSSGVTQSYRRFVYLGRKFYKTLIEPSLKYTDRKNFTIVPDGAITYIPFEGLMSEDVLDTININYMTLPYMIRDYSVGYSHSSTLMFNQRIKTRPTKAKVLAFAPNYKNTLHGIDTALYRQVSEADEYLPPLVGTIKEVQSIKETVPADVFLNETATEANFKAHAKDYNVLHLAMHTRMKDDNPLNSLLAFTNVESGEVEDTTDQEDNKLYAYEIYNMTLNAQMAVLSSCNSGFGKMQKGEGMMSLGRGFIYAGCPSIIMTLWQVADKSSSELMTSFYKHLKKGKSKQEALRMAKIDYLESADDLTSNPYFWSGFVVLGDSSPIYRKSGVAYWMIVIALFAGIMIFIQYRRS